MELSRVGSQPSSSLEKCVNSWLPGLAFVGFFEACNLAHVLQYVSNLKYTFVARLTSGGEGIMIASLLRMK